MNWLTQLVFLGKENKHITHVSFDGYKQQMKEICKKIKNYFLSSSFYPLEVAILKFPGEYSFLSCLFSLCDILMLNNVRLALLS